MGLIRPAYVLFFVTMVGLTSMISLPTVMGKREKIWPDFSCHPINGAHGDSSYNLAKFFWDDCLQEERDLNLCAKTCSLRRQFMVYQRCGPKCNVTVDVDLMGSRLSQQQGYEEDNQPEGDALVRKVEQDLTKCRDNHPEIVTLQMKAPCDDRWNPFISCIEKAFGCV